MTYMTKSMKRMALGMASVALIAMGTGCVPVNEEEPQVEEALSAASYSKRSNALRTQLMCRATFECPQPSSSLVAVLGRYADEEACVEGAAKMVRDTSLDDELLRIGSTINEEQAQRCLEALETQLRRGACDIDPNPSVCDGVFQGPGGEGDACGSDYHCGQGLHCDTWEDEGCGGTCVPDADDAPVSTCGDEVCGDDEQCDVDTCVLKGAAGESCSPYGLDDCTRVSDDVVCIPDDATYTSGTCVAMGTLPAGAFCDYVDDACASGLACDYTSVTCAPTEPVQPMQLGAAGEVCNLAEAPCGPGLACAGEGVFYEGGYGTCAPVKGAGQVCDHVLECAPGLACLTDAGDGALTDGTCATPAADGMSCHTSLDCASGHCEVGVCTRRELTTCAQ